MYRAMTHYEFILALHTVLSSYKTHYELIVCFCELSTVSKNKHEHIVCHCPVHGEQRKEIQCHSNDTSSA